MDYPGEHLAPGQLGHFFLILSFVASLGATFSYFLSGYNLNRNQDLAAASWKKLGRIFFALETFAVLAIFATLFYIIRNHYFEYNYAWKHSNLALESQYLLSCFWEGQEGSFLLWSFWHCVLGLIIIWREKVWESHVMTVISAVQLILATMILGIPALGWMSGSNPFQLLRNTSVLNNAPVFYDINGALRSDYLTMIKDGNGLNPLLQNYWMVIHPPVLFLGFASTLIPFAYGIAGLWTKRYAEWVKPVLPWTLFSAAVLGTGIMMGAAWAYESLNFGGYWAWDPVENASLVPWLTLVAGLHTLLIFRHTGNALRTSFLFLILTFCFILYSTYLTRSGDLQDTSVHAFTGEGISAWHLRFLLLIFSVPALTLFAIRYKKIPFIAKEEETSSREFWMYVGSLVLFLSAAIIIIMTSIPVFNKIMALLSGKDKLVNPFMPGEDSEYSYNRIQIYVAIILGIFTGFGMYLKYKITPSPHRRRMLVPIIGGLVVGGLILALGNIKYLVQGWGYQVAIWIALLAAVYSLVANGMYIFTGLKGRLRKAGGAIAHVGFAMMLAGILISSSLKEVLSYNTSGIPVFFGNDSKEKPMENLTLVKGLRTDMGKYFVTYSKDSVHPDKPLWFYHLDFERKDGKENFTLTPNAFVNFKGNGGLMANPSSRHYLTHDIFTYITSLADPNAKKDTSTFRTTELTLGDTLFYSKGFMTLADLRSEKSIPGVSFGPNDSATIATLKVQAQTGSNYTLQAVLVNKGSESWSKTDTLIQENLMVKLESGKGRKASIAVKETDSIMEYVTLKAYKFPWILLLWVGTLVMVAGLLIAMVDRRQKKRAQL